jgi:uncharacterized protein (TIGR02594 family)
MRCILAALIAFVCLSVLSIEAQAQTCRQIDRSRGVMTKVACPPALKVKASKRKQTAHQRRPFHKARKHHRRVPRAAVRPVVDRSTYVPEYESRASLAASQPATRFAVDRVQKPERLARAARGDETSGGPDRLVNEARRWLGTNPTHRRSLWCATFMNFVLQRVGMRGTGSDMASSFARIGQRVSGPQVGAIAVMTRRGGGHVGVVSGVDVNGNPIIISGNHRRTVAESVYPPGRVYAYVKP